MRLHRVAALFLSLILLTQPLVLLAFETDQFNLPPEPLADIGDEVSDYVEESLSKAIYKLNGEISVRERCLENDSESSEDLKCGSAEKDRKKLAYLRSEDAVAKEIYNLLGTGIPPFTSSGSWLESHQFKHQPARFRTGLWKSIYLIFPIDYIGIGSTVNMYGSQFGTDKIAHFFQQGYDYFKIYREELAKERSPDKAAEKAVKWGQKTERGIFGTLLTGVYSNADLAANYAGLKFYHGLTREINIGSRRRPPVLLLKSGVWAFNDNIDLRETLIKPFISEHLNEALNPSIYTKHFGLRAFVRRSVKKKSCRQWRELYPNLLQEDFKKISKTLSRWHGEDYGFTDSENFVTIANTCFGEENSTVNRAE
jgi:hypothetical protein